MDFHTANKKIIKIIEEKYLKDFHKEMKKFQIIMTGYNASKYKSLQVFKKYGWKLSSSPLIFGNKQMYCVFKNKISSNSFIKINLVKDLKTGILKSDQNIAHDICVKMYVERSDEIFNIIEQTIEHKFSLIQFGNDSLKIVIERMIDGGYVLTIHCSNF